MSSQVHLINNSDEDIDIDIDSDAYLELALQGRNASTRPKVVAYLEYLKKTGCSFTAAAAQVRISYSTILDARARFPEFEVLEQIAFNTRLGPIDAKVADNAEDGKEVGWAALFYKRRGELAERVEIATSNELPTEAYSAETRQMMLKDQLVFAAKVKSNGK